MNTQSNAIPEATAASQATAVADISPTRRMYWSVQRELWEHRSLYLAPLAVGALIVLSSLIGIIHLPGKMHAASALVPVHHRDALMEPYMFAALLLMGVALVVSIFYCLDALHGERRDRSILFWKSLPVSDLATVLAKASIPIVVVPLITFAITVAAQAVMMLVGMARLLGSGEAVTLWNQVGLFQMWGILFFHLLALHGFWYAPFYGWMLLASAWARRAPFLWAVLPPLAIGMLEKIAFNTSYFGTTLLHHFMSGSNDHGSSTGNRVMDALMPLTPSQWLVSPGLWVGLAITAAFLAAAVQLRRSREPN